MSAVVQRLRELLQRKRASEEPEEPEEPEEEITDLQRVQRTAREVLRHTYLRALLLREGRSPEEVPPQEAAELLLDHEHYLEADGAMLDLCMEQAVLLGQQQVHNYLHGRPGVDDEMLDEAVEYAVPIGRR